MEADSKSWFIGAREVVKCVNFALMTVLRFFRDSIYQIFSFLWDPRFLLSFLSIFHIFHPPKIFPVCPIFPQRLCFNYKWAGRSCGGLFYPLSGSCRYYLGKNHDGIDYIVCFLITAVTDSISWVFVFEDWSIQNRKVSRCVFFYSPSFSCRVREKAALPSHLIIQSRQLPSQSWLFRLGN